MRLLTEFFDQIEYLTEQTAQGKVLYLEGPMVFHSAENRNKRIYSEDVARNAVGTYIKEYVNERRAIGELNHPNRPFPDPATFMVKPVFWTPLKARSSKLLWKPTTKWACPPEV
jgi:hypothetical protein